MKWNEKYLIKKEKGKSENPNNMTTGWVWGASDYKLLTRVTWRTDVSLFFHLYLTPPQSCMSPQF